MYKLVKALDSKNRPFWVITENSIPEYYSSLFIKQKAHNSINTAKTYGEKLVYFLNYLNRRNKRYWDVDMPTIKDFILEILNFDGQGNLTVTPSIGFSTVSLYKTIIVSFYKFLSIWSEDALLIFIKTNSIQEFAVHIKTSWEKMAQIIQATLDLHLVKYKITEKYYIKEYQPEELNAIYSQFRSIRNKAIFLLSLHGMRIDEVLSIKSIDYDATEQTVKPSRSKGKGNAKKRTIVISNECIHVIENYLLNERAVVENKLKKDSQYLFVNLRISELDDKLQPLQYQSFYQSLKIAANNAKVDGVRSHTGRSHRAIELLRLVRDGEVGLTDEHWRIIMGWKSIESSAPYVQHENERKAIDIAKELELMKTKLLK